MERGGGAARAADADTGQPRTARAPGTEFRSGFGRHSYPSLGPIALTYPLADFLPFIEGPPLPTPGLKTWGFFWHVLRQVAPMARARGTTATNPPHVVASCVLSRRLAARQRPPLLRCVCAGFRQTWGLGVKIDATFAAM